MIHTDNKKSPILTSKMHNIKTTVNCNPKMCREEKNWLGGRDKVNFYLDILF